MEKQTKITSGAVIEPTEHVATTESVPLSDLFSLKTMYYIQFVVSQVYFNTIDITSKHFTTFHCCTSGLCTYISK